MATVQHAATNQPQQTFRPSRAFRWLIVWPLALTWRVVTAIANFTGILLALVLGFVLVAVGLLLCSTIIGFIFGAPLVFIGALLLLRALY